MTPLPDRLTTWRRPAVLAALTAVWMLAAPRLASYDDYVVVLAALATITAVDATRHLNIHDGYRAARDELGDHDIALHRWTATPRRPLPDHRDGIELWSDLHRRTANAAELVRQTMPHLPQGLADQLQVSLDADLDSWWASADRWLSSNRSDSTHDHPDLQTAEQITHHIETAAAELQPIRDLHATSDESKIRSVATTVIRTWRDVETADQATPTPMPDTESD